jgi:general secretion pathway protein F
MPAFRFEAADSSGKLQKGVLDAESPRHVRSLLKDRGLTPLAVGPVQPNELRQNVFAAKVSSLDLALCTRQLASLLSAKLPIEQSLNAVIEQAEKTTVRERFAAVRSDVVAGQTLSQALAKYPKDFPEVYRALVAAGEQSGELGQVMGKLADYVESRNNLSSKLVLAFTYPAIVSVVAILVVFALLTYVVPQIIGVFEQTKQALPMPTLILIAISKFLRSWGWILLGMLVAAAIGFQMALRSPSFKLAWHAKLLNLPVFGRLIRGANTARFASTLSILTSSGVPLIRGLEAGQKTLGNEALKANVADAISRVREGVPLSKALAAGKQFPPMMVHMIASGEATGELAPMLERTAATMSAETERKALALTSILEPVMVLVMGVVVLFIVLAVLMPIIDSNQLVK